MTNTRQPNILAIHTGGTISMQENELGLVSTQASNPLAQIEQQSVNLTNIELLNKPSPHINFNDMHLIMDTVFSNYDQYDGFVITHGTDTLEETAYYLLETLPHDKPVAITGAMRSSNEIGSDGLYNFLSAIRVVSDTNPLNKGVYIVFNDEVHDAKYVTKSHTTNTNTFQSPNHGPVAIITKDKIVYFHEPSINTHHHVKKSIHSNIALLKAYVGMDSELLTYIAHSNYNGVVIEALGQGNLPPNTLNGLYELKKQNIPVVILSRCINGIVGGYYNYKGGGHDLIKYDVIFSYNINAVKSRILLGLLLENEVNHEDMAFYFSS
ncbi:asparaginase [Abyssicoccus albus]|uniref:asparaginase n=1 Tax=Abyssicoccus albus TaxID=1817405 RepID=UPI001CEF7E0F|nr:asparaginase [Abyssicoccus albus]